MKYITILNFRDSTIIEGTIDDEDDVDNILEKNNLKETDCNWMVSEEQPERFALRR